MATALAFTEQSKPFVMLASIDRVSDGGYVGTFAVFDDKLEQGDPEAVTKILRSTSAV